MSAYLPSRALIAALILALAVTLSSCSSTDTGANDKTATGNSVPSKSAASQSTAPTSAAASPSAAADAITELRLGTTAAGAAIVDQTGRAIYRYDGDIKESGVSACVENCSAQFPPVHAGSMPALTGLTLTLGAIAGSDGQQQLTINGLPIYYFSGDTAPGQTGGQAKDRMWWTLDKNGSANST